MNFLLIAIILALVPLINFFLKYYFSSAIGQINLFRQHLMTYYADWLFVLFNFFWIYTFNLDIMINFILISISIIATLSLQVYWINLHKKEKRKCYMWNIYSKKITLAGIVEVVFAIIETYLILAFVFSTSRSLFVYLECFILFIFLLLAIPSSIRIHGKISKNDLILVISGFIAIIGKVLFTILY